ncbi:beta-propeller domain-containing protein [Phocea massiliensis]|uniref:Beta propeller domain protein n=1 Tax=uncultured Anaerotruncus sp. TaxID=905011 RepID=A0A6N2REY2_9FIRM|nr:beta-propeller domain-containing protein [Merdimmobilis hominis]MCD4836631.1 beta-propeller domain-containing protein [Merdimmobilis hominis]
MTDSDKKMENMAWLQEKFQAETERIELPPSLTSQALLHLLEDVEPEEESPPPQGPAKVVHPRWGNWKPWAAAAAIALVAATAFHQFGGSLVANGNLITSASSSAASASADSGKPDESAPGNTALFSGAAGISYASDYSQVRTLLAPKESERVEYYQEETGEPASGATMDGVSPEEGMLKAPVPTNPLTAGEPTPQMEEESAAISEGDAATGSASEKSTAPPAPMAGNALVTGDAGFTAANQQVAGVEESDIVKTDGDSLFIHTNTASSTPEVVIVDASSMEKLSTITLEPSYGASELYLWDETLVVMQTEAPSALPFQKGISEATASDNKSYQKAAQGETPSHSGMAESNTSYRDAFVISATLFDVSDREQPKEIRRFEQDGSYVSSRVSDGTLYLVSQKYVWGDSSDEDTPLDELVPVTGDSLNQASQLLEAQSIVYCPDVEIDPVYTVVSALNLSDCQQPANTKAVLGSADEIYMSKDNLYLAGSSDGSSTNLVRVAVEGSDIHFAATGKVPGQVLGQFSMDESGGYFRVASTSFSDSGTVNNLYVLDQSLKQVGSVEGLAPGESIKSVRYLGDTAYVVTFREVDPLFAIDLSTPSKPKVLGQLKTPGFSEYLHPVDSSTLIGFGTNTTVAENGAVMENGMKLSLFDVSDPLHPKESQVFYLGNQGSSSEGKENHKAFFYDGQRGQIGFPATIATQVDKDKADPLSSQNEITFSGYLLLDFSKEDGFSIAAYFPNGGEGNGVSALGDRIRRGVRIGESFYTISGQQLIRYSLKDYEQSGSVAL